MKSIWIETTVVLHIILIAYFLLHKKKNKSGILVWQSLDLYSPQNWYTTDI